MNILCSTAFKGVMPFILDQYQHNNSSLRISYGTTLELVENCITNKDVDAILVTDSGIDTLLKQHKLVETSVTTIAKTGIGIAIAKNAEGFDISTAKSFQDTLLQCKSIAFTQYGASGMYFAKLIQQLNIENEILSKAIRPEGGLVATLVENHQAELAVQLVSEIKAVKGVDLLGLIPEEYQEWSIFKIAKTSNSKSDEVDQLIEFIKNPELQKQLEPFGFFN
jgi:molybdate transport system substrate-binding protein